MFAAAAAAAADSHDLKRKKHVLKTVK